MSILKRSNKGFTFIEVLIALAISAFVLTGVYAMMASAVRSKEQLDGVNELLFTTKALQRLIARDIRMAYTAPLPADYSVPGNRHVGFLSQNSLYFNKSMAVYIYYYVDEDTLYRREANKDMNYEMEIPLLSGVSGWKTETFINGEYREGFDIKRHLFRFSFTSSGHDLSFIAGKLVK